MEQELVQVLFDNREIELEMVRYVGRNGDFLPLAMAAFVYSFDDDVLFCCLNLERIDWSLVCELVNERLGV